MRHMPPTHAGPNASSTSSHHHTVENQALPRRNKTFRAEKQFRHTIKKAITTIQKVIMQENNTNNMETFKAKLQDNHDCEYNAGHFESQTLTGHNHNLKFGEALLEKVEMATDEFKDKSVHEKEAKFENHTRDHQNHRYKNTLHLWEFLLQLLSDQRAVSIISWSRKEHDEFKIKNPDEVAKRWGELKQRPGMNYDKLSRAIRSYYPRQIITKVPGQRLVYKFDKLPYEYMPGVVESHLAKRRWLSRETRNMDSSCSQTPSPSHALSNSLQSLSLSLTVPPTAIVAHSTAPSLSTASFPGNASSRNSYQSPLALIESSSTNLHKLQLMLPAQDLNEGCDMVPLSAPLYISTAKFFSAALPSNPTPVSLATLVRRNSIPVSVITRNNSFRTISPDIST